MTRFEQELVNAFNHHFGENNLRAVAHRIRQAKYTGQFCDVLVDSPREEFYLAVENKSLKQDSREKLYFTQHFSNGEQHQVEEMNEFLRRSGRTGFLALEMRYGRGKPRRGFLLPWTIINTRFQGEATGITVQEIEEHPETVELERSDAYRIPEGFP